MTEIEIRAEIYKIMRANDGKSAKFIWAEIKKHMPNIPKEKIIKSIEKLMEGI